MTPKKCMTGTLFIAVSVLLMIAQHVRSHLRSQGQTMILNRTDKDTSVYYLKHVFTEFFFIHSRVFLLYLRCYNNVQ